MSKLPDVSPIEEQDGDRTSWLVTFSDLVLQLFAFVIVAVVLEAGRGPVTPSPAVAARPPEPVAATEASVPRPLEIGWPIERAVAPPDGPPESVVASVELSPGEEPTETPCAGPSVEPPAVEVEVEVVAPAAPDARLVSLGRYFEQLLEAGGIDDAARVRVDDGAVVVSLGEAVGFAPGSDRVPDAGLAVLAGVATLARSMPELGVAVSGHTDDRPIRTVRFPSNLHLSLARAARVAEALTDEDPALRGRVYASGYGADRPVAPNDTPDGRERNRRVEIRLVPNG